MGRSYLMELLSMCIFLLMTGLLLWVSRSDKEFFSEGFGD